MRQLDYDTMDDFMYHLLLKIIMAVTIVTAVFYLAGWEVPQCWDYTVLAVEEQEHFSF